MLGAITHLRSIASKVGTHGGIGTRNILIGSVRHSSDDRFKGYASPDSPGSVSAGSGAFARRERAQEDYYIRQREREQIEVLRKELAAREAQYKQKYCDDPDHDCSEGHDNTGISENLEAPGTCVRERVENGEKKRVPQDLDNYILDGYHRL